MSAQTIDCGYSLELPCRGGSNEYPQSMFWAEIWKMSVFFLSENFPFLFVKFSMYLNRLVFVMECHNLIYISRKEAYHISKQWELRSVCNICYLINGCLSVDSKGLWVHRLILQVSVPSNSCRWYPEKIYDYTNSAHPDQFLYTCMWTINTQNRLCICAVRSESWFPSDRIIEYTLYLWRLTLSVPNFRQHLSSTFFLS